METRQPFDDQGPVDRRRLVDRPSKVDFALYSTFIDNTFALVTLIRAGFTLQQTQDPNKLNCISAAYDIEKSLELSRFNYSVNREPAYDLANLQFLCGPCNSTKKDDGEPLNLPTRII